MKTPHSCTCDLQAERVHGSHHGSPRCTCVETYLTAIFSLLHSLVLPKTYLLVSSGRTHLKSLSLVEVPATGQSFVSSEEKTAHWQQAMMAMWEWIPLMTSRGSSVLTWGRNTASFLCQRNLFLVLSLKLVEEYGRIFRGFHKSSSDEDFCQDNRQELDKGAIVILLHRQRLFFNPTLNILYSSDCHRTE